MDNHADSAIPTRKPNAAASSGVDSTDLGTTLRSRLLAISLPVAAGLYFAAVALNPKGTDQVITTMAAAATVLSIAAKHTTQLFISGSLTVLALGALAIAYAAIASLATRRGAGLATVAAVIGVVANFSGAIYNVLVGFNLAAAASSPISRQAAARFLVTTFDSGFATAFSSVYFVGIYLAPILMGAALWRSRSVPRWLAIFFAVSLEVAQQAPAKGVVAASYTLPFVVAMMLLAVRVWRRDCQPTRLDSCRREVISSFM
jgi:hypothetical protein